MVLKPIEGERYVIYVPDEGWILFEYGDASYKSINVDGEPLKIYRNFSSSTSAAATQLIYDELAVESQGLVVCRLYRESVVVNPSLAPQSAAPKLVIPRESAELQAIFNDPMAMVLYHVVVSVLPFVDCMAVLVEAIHSAQLSSQRTMINTAQEAARVAAQVQEMVDKVQDSFFFKMMNSPTFAIFFVVFAVVLTLLAAIATLLTGGAATALWITILVIIVVVFAAAGVVIFVSADTLNREMEELQESFGPSVDPAVKEAFQNLEKMVNAAAVMLFGAIVLTAVMSVLAGYMSVSGPFGAQKQVASMNEQRERKGEEPLTQTEERSVYVGSVSKTTGQSAGGVAAILQGIGNVTEGQYQKAMAPLAELHSIVQARAKEWEAQSKYFGTILKHLQEGMKECWKYIEDMITSQSSVIQNVGDMSASIVRNIT